MSRNTTEYDRAYYRQVRRQRDGNRIGRAIVELDKAVEALTDEFNAGLAGPSGLRAQGLAHVRQARLILEGGGRVSEAEETTSGRRLLNLRNRRKSAMPSASDTCPSLGLEARKP